MKSGRLSEKKHFGVHEFFLILDYGGMNESGQSGARERVVKEAFGCRAALEAYAYGFLKQHAEAQDVVQDAFLVVFDKWESFEEGTSMIAWTRAIVRRKVLQALDRRKRQQTLQDRVLNDAVDAAFETAHGEGAAELLLEKGQRLDQCMSRLSVRSRDLLKEVYQERCSYEEASTKLGMGVEAVRKALYRSKATLRKCLGRELSMEEVAG